MTAYYSTELAGIDSLPLVKPSATHGVNAALRRFRATVDLSAQAQITTSDTINLVDVPAGMAFAFGILVSTVTLGASATLAFGITGATGKYRAAAVHTAVNTPVFFGLAAAVAAGPLTARERIFATIAAASLPASGVFVADFYFSNG